MNYRKFLSLFPQKRMICFGAGRAAKNFFHSISEYHLEKYTEFFCDNSSQKWGKYIEIGNKKIKIVSPDELKQQITTEHVVVITCVSYHEVFDQLSRYRELENTIILNYGELRDEIFYEKSINVKLPSDLRQSSQMIIPKVIHYCWFGGNPLPAKYKKWMESWRRFCPDYEIVEWNEGNYDVMKHPYMKAAYKNGVWAMVSDYARLDIIYDYGGIYFDTDVEVVRNFDELLYEDGFVGFDFTGRVSLGLGFGARKGFNVIKQLRDDYDDYEYIPFCSANDFKERRYKDKLLTCPEIQTKFLTEKGLLEDCFTYQRIMGLTVYPVPVLCGKVGNRIIDSDNVFSIHHYTGAWMTEQLKEI